MVQLMRVKVFQFFFLLTLGINSSSRQEVVVCCLLSASALLPAVEHADEEQHLSRTWTQY